MKLYDDQKRVIPCELSIRPSCVFPLESSADHDINTDAKKNGDVPNTSSKWMKWAVIKIRPTTHADVINRTGKHNF